MKKCWILSRFTLISLLLVALLLLASACSIPTQDETEMLEDLLNRLDAVEGEITFVTKDGETVKIQITKESKESNQLTSEENGITKNVDKKALTADKSTNIFPTICSKEDVFELLGVLDKAKELRNKGLSWCSTAQELGYTSDSMYAQLKDIAVRELNDAVTDGLIDQEQMNKKLSEFTATAKKWVDKIFADSSISPAVSLNDYLPVLNSKEDVFKTLGIWDQAHSLREQGLAWSHVAAELGYDSDSMYTALVAKIKAMLNEAYSVGLLSQEKLEYKIGFYSDMGLKWIKKIFSDTTSDTPVSITDLLPALESYEDVFSLLGIWEKASALQAQDKSWSSVATELGYSEESMYKKIRGIAEQELHDAKISGLISYDQYKEMLELYSNTAESWIQEIFADVSITS